MAFIGKKKISELLGGCSEATIYRLEKNGHLPPKMNLPGGRMALWDEAEVLKCLKTLAQVSVMPATDKPPRYGSGKPGPGRPKKKLAATAAA